MSSPVISHSVVRLDDNNSTKGEIKFAIDSKILDTTLPLIDNFSSQSVLKYKEAIEFVENEKVKLFDTLHKLWAGDNWKHGIVVGPEHNCNTLKEQVRCLLVIELYLKAQLQCINVIKDILAGNTLDPRGEEGDIKNTYTLTQYFNIIYANNFNQKPDLSPVYKYVITCLIITSRMLENAIHIGGIDVFNRISVVDWWCEQKLIRHDRKVFNQAFVYFIKTYYSVFKKHVKKYRIKDMTDAEYLEAWDIYRKIPLQTKTKWLNGVSSNTRYTSIIGNALRGLLKRAKHLIHNLGKDDNHQSMDLQKICFFCRLMDYENRISPATSRYTQTNIGGRNINHELDNILHGYVYKSDEENFVDTKWLIKNGLWYLNQQRSKCCHFIKTPLHISRSNRINTLQLAIKQMNASSNSCINNNTDNNTSTEYNTNDDLGSIAANKKLIEYLSKKCTTARKDMENKVDPNIIQHVRGSSEINKCCNHNKLEKDNIGAVHHTISELNTKRVVCNMLRGIVGKGNENTLQYQNGFELYICIYLCIKYSNQNNFLINQFLDREIERITDYPTIREKYIKPIDSLKLNILNKVKYISTQMSLNVLTTIDEYINPTCPRHNIHEERDETNELTEEPGLGLYYQLLGLEMSQYYYNQGLSDHTIINGVDFISSGPESFFMTQLYNVGLKRDTDVDLELIKELQSSIDMYIFQESVSQKTSEKDMVYICEPLAQMHMTYSVCHPLLRYSFYYIHYLSGLGIEPATANLMYTIPIFALSRPDCSYGELIHVMSDNDWFGDSIYACIYTRYYNQLIKQGYSLREIDFFYAGDYSNTPCSYYNQNIPRHRYDYKHIDYQSHPVIVGYGKYVIFPNIQVVKDNAPKGRIWSNIAISCNTAREYITNCCLIDIFTRDYSIVVQKFKNVSPVCLTRLVEIFRIFSENTDNLD